MESGEPYGVRSTAGGGSTKQKKKNRSETTNVQSSQYMHRVNEPPLMTSVCFPLLNGNTLARKFTKPKESFNTYSDRVGLR